MEEVKAERDYEQEVRQLYEQHPELRQQQLPEDVVKACVDGRNLAEAYGDYVNRETEKQNARSARQAPVRGVTKGGSVSNQPEDAFLRGFNSGW